MWTGETALKLKLVDRLGGLDAAVAEAARLGGIKGEVRTIDIETRRSDVAALLGSFFGPEDSAGDSNGAVRDGWSGLVKREQMRVMAMLGDLRVLGSGATMQASCLECAGMGSPRPAQALRVETALRALVAGR